MATARQLEVLRFISEFQLQFQRAPTIREIGLRLSINSTNGVADHLKALERHGLVERDHMKARSLRLTSLAREVLCDEPALHDAATDALALLMMLLDKPLGERFDRVVKLTIAKLNAAGVR